MAEGTFGALCRLDPGWQVFRNRHIVVDGAQCRINFIILHRDFGIGLVVLTREEYSVPEIAVRATRTLLRQRGFERRFPGFLPIVFVALDADNIEAAPNRIAAAFTAAPPLGVKDAGWVDWTADTFEALGGEGDDEPPEPSGAAIEIDDAPWPAAGARRSWRFPVKGRTAWIGAALLALVLSATSLAAFPGGLALLRPLVSGPSAATPAGAGTARGAVPERAGPRLLSEERAAAYLGLDPAQFRGKLPALLAGGFPAAEPITGNFDKAAIDRWLDRRGGQE